ncbi:MAG: carboxypeptidase-like regulatory domain-containing protein [Planctomycetota bacterium]
MRNARVMENSDPNNDGLGMWIKVSSTLVLLFLLAAGLSKAARFANREDPAYVALGATSGAAVGREEGSVSGIVVDRAGKSVPNLPLDWLMEVGDVGPSVLGGSVMEGGKFQTVTNAEGEFEFTGLPVGEGQVGIDVDDHFADGKPLEGLSGRIEVRAGFAATEIRVEAREVPADRILRGTVVDAAGDPVGGMRVKLNRDGWIFSGQFMATQTTSADGQFLFIAPSAGGPITLEWAASAGSSNTWKLDDFGAENLRIILK